MTHRCPRCGKNLRAHLDGGACNIFTTATATPPNRASRTRRQRQ